MMIQCFYNSHVTTHLTPMTPSLSTSMIDTNDMISSSVSRSPSSLIVVLQQHQQHQQQQQQ
jgi:hypothetical protein